MRGGVSSDAPSMKPLCIAAIANEAYQEYIPLYLYFVLRAYPQYELIVYFDGTMHPEVAASVDLVRDMGHFRIKPIRQAYDKSNSQAIKSLRWLLVDEEFYDYDNVYIGDIDMFIVPEETPLHELHVRHSSEIGLPYSNRVRRGQRRLTGLHFVRTRAYYERVIPTIRTYRDAALSGSLGINNEELLYRMMDESVGLPKMVGNFVSYHGIHARAFCEFHDLAFQRTRGDFVFSRHFEPYAEPFLDATNTARFEDIRQALARIAYPSRTLEQYRFAGPGVLRQIEVILTLCGALGEERDAPTTPTK